MKKITPEEAAALPKVLEKRSHPVTNWLRQLQVGENLLVPRNEWTWKSKSPSHLCRNLERTTKLRFDCFRLLDGAGWLITRTV